MKIPVKVKNKHGFLYQGKRYAYGEWLELERNEAFNAFKMGVVMPVQTKSEDGEFVFVEKRA